MRKHAKKAKNSGKKFRRLSLATIIVATAILVIGAVTVVVSRQNGSVGRPSASEAKSPLANKAGKNFVTVKVAGQDVQVDGQTEQIQELTPEEARKLAAGIKQLVNKSDQGLSEVHHDDGSVSVNLEGRFQHVTVARVNEDGTVSQSCVDNPRAAAAFFGINPRLIEDVPESPRKPTMSRPENN